jgi:hypothetical protein
MTKFKLVLPVAAALLMAVSCNGGGHSEQTTDTLAVTTDTIQQDEVTSIVVQEKNGIKLTKVTDSPDFPEAKIKLNAPKSNSVQGSKVVFNTTVENFTLTQQTPVGHEHCANSAKGQHIHLILNNEPYIANYETTFEQDLQPGGYVALMFLSRSYHESLKHKDSYALDYFRVGPKAIKNDVDLKKPLMFNSRPKGDYKGEKETKRVLLDFYLVNTELAEDGYKVKATIDGTDFMITKWEPYFIEGLPLGEHTIRLELLDKDGKTVANKFNPVERKINLMEAEAPAK